MNAKFLELSEEKQLRIINAGFHVFSQNEYKKASTEEIAHIADISKGLLFYYFHNKKELYMFLYEQAMKIVTESVTNKDYTKITDFFELCGYAARQKHEILSKAPYVMDFLLKAYYSQKEEVSKELNQKMLATISTIYGDYFKHIDLSKFKETIDPKEVLNMLTWMSDGYLHEVRRTGQPMNIGEHMDKYKRWSELIKQIAYKEEYV